MGEDKKDTKKGKTQTLEVQNVLLGVETFFTANKKKDKNKKEK